MAPGPAAAPVSPRALATLLWAALVALLLAFLGLVLAVEAPAEDARAPGPLLLGLAVASSALGIALSRLLPPRIPARQAGGNPGANAITRLLIAWAAVVVVAAFPLVAHTLRHDHRLLGVFAVDLLALLTLYPSGDAWARLASDRVGAGPGRTVR